MRKFAMLGLLMVPVLSASAQSQGTELSVRIASLGFASSSGSNTTTLDVGNGGGGLWSFSGGGGVGVGFYLSSGMAIEPSASLLYLHSDGETTTITGLGLALPIYFDKTWGHSGLYFAPGVGLRSVKFEGSSSESQYSISGEVGTKLQVSDPVSLRLALNATNWFKKTGSSTSSSSPSVFNIAAIFGVSVFFKK